MTKKGVTQKGPAARSSSREKADTHAKSGPEIQKPQKRWASDRKPRTQHKLAQGKKIGGILCEEHRNAEEMWFVGRRGYRDIMEKRLCDARWNFVSLFSSSRRRG